ncbi:MAG: DUF6901 family protein [Actinomycetota bacterium]
MPQTITYRFYLPEGQKTDVGLSFDDESFRLVLPADAPRPDWTRLGHQRCPNCPLPAETAFCPAALALALFLPAFESRVSYEKAVVEVDTPNRTIVSKTTVQSAMASLIGLALATSGCPRTRFLRPMARTHLPFATEQETVFRALAAHLLGRFVVARLKGEQADLSLDDLKDAYAQLSTVNSALAERIRSAVTRDAALNAVIILDGFAQIAPENIECGFEDILHCFAVEGD